MMGRHRGRSNPVSMHRPFFPPKFPLRQPKRWFIQWGRFRCMHWLRDLQVLEEVQVLSAQVAAQVAAQVEAAPAGWLLMPGTYPMYLLLVPGCAWFFFHPLPPQVPTLPGPNCQVSTYRFSPGKQTWTARWSHCPEGRFFEPPPPQKVCGVLCPHVTLSVGCKYQSTPYLPPGSP